jgi:hypothetical protein
MTKYQEMAKELVKQTRAQVLLTKTSFTTIAESLGVVRQTVSNNLDRDDISLSMFLARTGRIRRQPVKGHRCRARRQGGGVMEQFIETLPHTAALFALSIGFLIVPAGVGFLLRYFSDEHPIIYWIVILAILFLEVNFMISLTAKTVA